MAYDQGLADLMRDDLADVAVVEKKMFGGLAFMRHGHMLCGIHKGGAMFRVGKANEARAQMIEGVLPMAFTGKTMAGFLDCTDECCADDVRRGQLMALALGFVDNLPPK